jgi:hypothetical protein
VRKSRHQQRRLIEHVLPLLDEPLGLPFVEGLIVEGGATRVSRSELATGSQPIPGAIT